MSQVTEADRCTCDPNAPAQERPGGWLSNLFGR